MNGKTKAGVTVAENGLCPLWEVSALPAVAVQRECWFCKWSDFREDTNEYRHTGLCHNPKRNEQQEEEV